MNCAWARANIETYLYDELSASERGSLEVHIESCESCAHLVQEERGLLQTLDERQRAEPSDALVADSRRTLARSLHQESRAARIAYYRESSLQWEGGRRLLAPLRPAWQPAAALALLLVGFSAGRVSQQPAPQPGGGPPVHYASLAPAEPPYAGIQSVTLDPEHGEVEIVVEEIIRRTITGPAQDPGVRSLLLSTVKAYPNSGLRLDTLDVLSQRVEDREVRRTLLESMLEDDNPGVRLKALEALKPYKEDPPVRQALVQVLRRDSNSGMRVQAVELLTESPDRDLAGLLQDLVENEMNSYIRLQCRRTLYDLNASVDRF